MITIIDYGMGNLGSVINMFKKIGVPAQIASKPDAILNAQKLILPGVGSFDSAMKRIQESDLYGTINYMVLEKEIPILGICLGMQLLTEGSAEGSMPGFGWIKGRAYNFKGRISPDLKIPHMGWNDVKIVSKNDLARNFTNDIRFYFVHSFFVQSSNPENTMMTCYYGLSFDAAIHQKNIYGVQFHPEKSHKFGMQLFRNFAEL
jgi:imidazole glycerol-phosphate synthase subunit HisH